MQNIKCELKVGDNIDDKLLFLYHYQVTTYNSIRLYTSSEATRVCTSTGESGYGLLSVQYADVNGSAGLNAPPELIKLMQDKFIEMVDFKIKTTQEFYSIAWLSDANVLKSIAKGVNETYIDWFIKNQDVTT